MSAPRPPHWPQSIGALGPTPGHPNRVSGKRATATGLTDADLQRLIDLHWPEPVSGLIIATVSPFTLGVDVWRTVLTCGGSNGGVTQDQNWQQARIAIPWCGTDVVLDAGAVAGRTVAAVAGLGGADSDIISPAFPIEVAIVTDAFSAGVASDDAPPITDRGLAISGVTKSAVAASVFAAGDFARMRMDNNQQQLVSLYAPWQAWARGVLNQNAFGAGGTATLIAAPGANLATVLNSLQIGTPSATTVVTVESPAATVLAAFNVPLAVTGMPVTIPSGLLGATNGAIVIRSSAVSTFSVNGQGYTLRVA